MNYRIVHRLCLSLLLLGSGARPMRATPLSEFSILDLDVTGEVNTENITVLFNPKEYTITKSTPWKHHDIQGLNAPDLEFTSGEPYRIQFELFFDRYEEGKSVREITDKIEKLALVQSDVHRPPMVLVSWGNELWENQLLEAKTEFVDFLPDGTPVAAIVRTTWSAFVQVPDKPVAPEFFPAVIAAPDAGVKLPAALDANSVQLLHLIDAPGLVLGQEIKINGEGEMMPRFRFAASPYRLQMQFEVDVSKGGIDPRALTEQMNRLVVSKDGHRPPIMLLTWGTGLAFKCILESFSLRYTLFLPDATPVRAKMNVTFKEFSPAEEQLKGNPRH